jgi:thymidylate synthase (FAD)
MEVKLISVTPDAEKIISYCARVSNSNNQENPEYEKLIRYCIKHNHVSILEMADMCVEIKTSRAIAAQILRHKSFCFQEFSQRYSIVNSFEVYDARRQDNKNKQNSIDDMSQEDKLWFKTIQDAINSTSMEFYRQALVKGIAKETARFLLPLSTQTTLYMKGSVRSWIHYLDVRTDPSTQLEHREVALAIKDIFIQQFPIVSKAKEYL